MFNPNRLITNVILNNMGIVIASIKFKVDGLILIRVNNKLLMPNTYGQERPFF